MVMLLSAMGVRAQEIIQCSPEKTFWLITEGGKNLAVQLSGEVKKTTHARVVMVNGKNMQYLITDKKPHADKAGSNDDMKVLANFVGSESGHIITRFMVTMEIKSEVVALTNGKNAIYWSHSMPEGKNEQVQMQHYINVIEGDKIFGLASAGFKGENAAETKQLLVDALGTLNTVKDRQNLCK